MLVFSMHVISCIIFCRYICENTQEEKAKGIANSPCSANLLGSWLSGVKKTKSSAFLQHEYFSDF